MLRDNRPAPFLDIEAIESCYGKNVVIRGVSLQVMQGEVVAIVGANAAGKTTTLRTIMGLMTMRAGRISFEGADITRSATIERVKRGLVLVPEGRQLFNDLSVRDNLIMGAFARPDRNHVQADLQRVYALFPRLEQRANQRSGSMSGGEQQMVAIGRGLMAKPRCLLLDEPTLGLAPIIITEIEGALRNLAAEGLTIVVSEQNAAMALNVSDRLYVLESGRIATSGYTEEMRHSEAIRGHYLGGSQQAPSRA